MVNDGMGMNRPSRIQPVWTEAAGTQRFWIPCLCVLALLWTIGCRSNRPSISQARQAYAIGDLQSAHASLTELLDAGRRTRRESQLDLAMVELASGETESAVRRLRDARDHFDSLSTSVDVKDAVSLVTDDTSRQFRLAGYEEVLLRTLLAIGSLAGDATDAEAYCLQAQEKQQVLIDQAEIKAAEAGTVDGQSDASVGMPLDGYTPIAIAPYLRGAIREATYQDYDDAERAFRLVSAIRPDFLPAGHDIQRVAEGAHCRPGHGVLYVIALVGHGPRLEESVAETTTASLQIASTLVRQKQQATDDERQVVLPTLASVKVPRVYVPASQTAAVGVTFQEQMLGATQTLTDLGQLAILRNETEMPWIIARAVARRALKESSVRATSQTLGLEGNAATAFEFAAVNAWAASEKADLRCWGLLPREIQVLRAELPLGPQRIELSPVSYQGTFVAEPIPYTVTIQDGRNSFVIVTAPETVTSVIPSQRRDPPPTEL